MYQQSEFFFKGHDGIELFAQSWTPKNYIGTLIITHGLGEHSECYSRLVEGLDKQKFKIFAWDLRGHGKSEGKRGVVSHFSDYSKDLNCFITHLNAHHLIDDPWFLVSHSMGALITSQFLIQYGPSGAKAATFSSPLFGITVEIPQFKKILSIGLSYLLPKVTLKSEVRYSDLSRDPEIVKNYEKDPLRQERVSAPLFLGILETIPFVFKNAHQIDIPILFQLAGQDRVVSTPDAEKLFNKISSKQKEKKIYKSSYHEIFNDINRTEVYQDLENFILNFISEK